MPAWGLTQEQREIEDGAGPWGLHPLLLAPAKVTTDPVHGDVYTTWLEQAIVDSPPFQRLRRIRQLGTTHLVYPGATHTRFSHSLGTLRVAQDLLDAVLTQHEGRNPVTDLVRQWRHDPNQAGRHVARATVVARLGALLHDLGHIPFGHSLEDDLKVLVEHDANERRFEELWEQLAAFVRERVREDEPFEAEASAALDSLKTLLDPEGDLHQELRPVVISKGPHTKARAELDYPFAADLVGNTICADLLDYLQRDHLYAGLPFALGRRFMSAFFIVPEGRGEFEKRLALSIMRGGHERTDVVTELLKALRYRYELSERALAHHAKLAADAMLGKALELWSDALWLQAAAHRLASLDDAETLRAGGDVEQMRMRFSEEFKGEYKRDETDPQRTIHPVNIALRERLEAELVGPGDDGLLETSRPSRTSPTDTSAYRQPQASTHVC
jgi:HD superfamily phosphohydrolase